MFLPCGEPQGTVYELRGFFAVRKPQMLLSTIRKRTIKAKIHGLFFQKLVSATGGDGWYTGGTRSSFYH